jgi:DNA-binding response OmpR family regulator
MASAQPPSDAAQHRVLLVDDDTVILRLLEVNFRLSGFAVLTAPGGERALELAATEPPDVVVSDVTMPGLDGYDVCERIRQIKGLESVPFVLLTARSEDSARARAEELGGVVFVSKPFDPGELVEIVRGSIEVPRT